MSDKKDDWNFKVDEADVPDPNKKISAAERVKQKSKKAEPQSHVEKKLDLDTGKLPPRQTMAQIARRNAALERYAEIEPATIAQRISSNLVDLVLFAGVFFSFYFFRDKLYTEYLAQLTSRGISQMYDPNLVKDVLVIGLFLITMFFLHVIPSIIWLKSLGKKFFKIRIGHADDDRGARSFQIFLREVIAKPISILVLLGFVLPFFNSRKRSVHDFIAGTTLYIDD